MKAFDPVDLALDALEAGGFTVRFADGTKPTEGFAVSVADHEKRLESLTPDGIAAYLAGLEPVLPAALLVFGPELCLGAWHGDKWYLDVSLVVDNYDEAMRLAVANGQRAIYDLTRGETIKVPYVGVA